MGASAAGLGLLSGCSTMILSRSPVPKVRRIAILAPASRDGGAATEAALLDGLRELGWTEGDNLSIDRRYAGGRTEVLPELAADLVRLDPEVIVASAQQASLAVQQQTHTIPIVAVSLGGDPVASGLVASLARPSGNVTGLKQPSGPTSLKSVELLKEIFPGLVRLAFLRDATNPAAVTGSIPAVKEAAQALGLQVLELDVRTVTDVPGAMAMASRWGADGLYVSIASIVEPLIASIVQLGTDNHLPGAYVVRNYVEAGGLMWYGSRATAIFHRSAAFVDKILRGSVPADLPVEDPTVFDLSINVSTLQALGLTIPPSVLPLVTEWIQ